MPVRANKSAVGAIMQMNKIFRLSDHPAGADKLALGAIMNINF